MGLLILSLGLNIFMAYKLNSSKETVANLSKEKALQTYLDNQEEDNTLITQSLDRLSKDDSVRILSKDNSDVTDVYKERFLELREKEDYKGAKDLMLQENLSISYDG